MTICLHPPFMVSITSDLCAPVSGSALYTRATNIPMENHHTVGMTGNLSHFMFVVSSAEVWKFWSKLWISRRSAWQRKITPGIKACCVCTLKVSIFWWKLHTPMQILPSNTENFPLTVNLTTELLFPCDRYSSVKSDYTLPQSFSHAPRLANAVGESYVNKNIIKARTCEDQTQEYNTINITRILWALYGPSSAWLTDSMVAGM